MAGPPPATKALPARRIEFILSSIFSGDDISCLICSIVRLMLGSGAPHVCKCDNRTDNTHCFLTVEFGGIRCFQSHPSRPPPTPPYQKRGLNTVSIGNEILQLFFSKNIGGDFDRWMILPCRSCRENGTRREFVVFFLHRRAQICFYLTHGSCQLHITPCCEHYDESVRQSASPARPDDIA